MDLTRHPVPRKLARAAEMEAFGRYAGAARCAVSVPWGWLVLPVLLLVTGPLGMAGLIEMDTSRQGEVDTGTFLFGTVLGAVFLVVAVLRYLGQDRTGIYFFDEGFIVDQGKTGATMLRWSSLLGHEYQDEKGRSVYLVRTEQQRHWTRVPPVRGLDEIGPSLMRRSGSAGSTPPTV
ncbi:hypothetical protein J4H86_20555 [Spiractinospora alimapuensis]|uniref:hypothetical protein n=1 Tax=Spiractinospora alimapuensis TaxID=2820884 RepID=UPI001F25631F|nr:hypothetical protein [Spiractinospora alimapuensis]QVQ51192.1 hypothetical protein J4H86_20555 [Spiractinospora alimapuensis]